MFCTQLVRKKVEHLLWAWQASLCTISTLAWPDLEPTLSDKHELHLVCAVLLYCTPFACHAFSAMLIGWMASLKSSGCA